MAAIGRARSKALHDPEPAQPRRIRKGLIRNLRAGVAPSRIGAPTPDQRRRRVPIADRLEQALQTLLAPIDLEEMRSSLIHEPIEDEAHTGRAIERSRIRRRIPQRAHRAEQRTLMLEGGDQRSPGVDLSAPRDHLDRHPAGQLAALDTAPQSAHGDPPLLWTHYPLRKVPEGHVNIDGHEHGKTPGMSPHINVSVEQLEYEPIGLTRLRGLARALIKGHYPPGATTIERIANLEQGTE